MAAPDNENRKKQKAHRSKKRRTKSRKHGHFPAFLYETVYEIITWVLIALSIGGIFFFASRDEMRGVFWCVIGLVILIILMIGLVADRHFFHGTTHHRAGTVPRDNAPLIAIEHIRGEPLIPEVGQTYRIEVKFVNRGHSPAKKVRAYIVTEPVAWDGKPNLSYAGDPMIRAGTIQPGGDGYAKVSPIRSKSTREERALTQELFNAIESGSVKIFVHGRIDYEESSGKPHWTTFCSYLITPFDGRFGVWSDETNQPDD